MDLRRQLLILISSKLKEEKLMESILKDKLALILVFKNHSLMLMKRVNKKQVKVMRWLT